MSDENFANDIFGNISIFFSAMSGWWGRAKEFPNIQALINVFVFDRGQKNLRETCPICLIIYLTINA